MLILKSRVFAALSVGVFVFGLASYSASSFQESQKAKPEPAREFRLVEIESEVDAKGVETFKTLRTKYVDGQGNWRVSALPIGKSGGVEYASSSGSLSATKAGIKKELGKTAESPELSEKARTIGFYEKNPALVGTEIIAGLKVYRLRTPLEQQGGWLELANSPKTGDIPLRVILHRPDGSEHRIEAVRVEFKDSQDR